MTRTERRSGLAEIFAGREALRRRVRAMENAAAVARAGGKSVTEEQRISQSAEIEFMAKSGLLRRRPAVGWNSGHKITSEEMRRFMPDVRASRNNIAMAAPSAA